jgi:hypothetical protein
MTAAQAIEGHEPPEVADLVDKRFARFGLHPLTDEEVWALAMACMVMPDGNPGAEGYLAKVAGTRLFTGRLAVWGAVVAIGIAGASYRARGGVRRRGYVEGYDEAWGRYAVADGLSLAIDGHAPGLVERCDVLGCGKQGYQRIRDFVGGALVNAIAEYRTALEWALGYRRDRVFEGRWEGVTGLKWDDARAREMMGREGKIYFPLFAPGCARIGGTQDADDRLKPRGGYDPKDPETLYRGLRPTDWWDAAYAARMRVACPAVTIYPATD